nr:carbohydrate kinase family protein [uncultured Cohaesibacter sp.]
MSKICILGNIGVDILHHVPRLPEAHEKVSSQKTSLARGGAPANVAHWLARLGHEIQFIGVTGSDLFSRYAIECLDKLGVDVNNVLQRDDVAPSLASIFVHGSEKSMICAGSSNKGKYWHGLFEKLDFSPFELVHCQSTLHEHLFCKRHATWLGKALVSTDLNGHYSRRLLQDFDLCFTNHDELTRALEGSDIASILDADFANRAYHLVVTNGQQPVFAHLPEAHVFCPVAPFKVVDATGAGDAFCAGYLHATLQGADVIACLETGIQLSKAALSGDGACPDNEEVDAIINGLS